IHPCRHGRLASGAAAKIIGEYGVNTQSIAIPQERGQFEVFIRFMWVALVAVTLAVSAALQAHARAAPESFADLADKVSPSVVNITTSTVVAAPAGPGPIVPEGSPFEDF